MSPILVRPVREQLEHDRVIRLLQARLRRRYDVAANVGDEQTASIRVGNLVIFPDLVLTSTERGHRLSGVIEVETGESVNHLEAMAQWAHLGKAPAPFYLYVPAGAVDIARRLCADHQVTAAEIWSYHPVGLQMRFTMVHRFPVAQPVRRRAAAARPRPAAPSKPAARAVARSARAKSAGKAHKATEAQKRK